MQTLEEKEQGIYKRLRSRVPKPRLAMGTGMLAGVVT